MAHPYTPYTYTSGCLMNLDIDYIETQLKKRLQHSYNWQRKQEDLWDRQTSFIYKTQHWEELLDYIDKKELAGASTKKAFFNYAINRWYNFWSAQAVEFFFTEIPGFAANPKPLENHYDFKWLGEPIDHKTSVFPRGFGRDYAFAKANKTQLLHWFYEHQSKGQRFYYNNRLFIVVYDQNGEHWKLKAELALLQSVIAPYGKENTPAVMQKLQVEEGKEVLADIIWVTR